MRSTERLPVTDPTRQLVYRQRILPEQLARARARYRGLLREAHRIGRTDILEPQEVQDGAP